jgi:hypothetical protein
MLAFFPNEFDPFDWFIPNLLDALTLGAILTMPRVIALGVVLISCHKHSSHGMMLAFFPNEFDPFDWFIPNLLDALTRGAISTAPRVVALGVASFFLP